MTRAPGGGGRGGGAARIECRRRYQINKVRVKSARYLTYVSLERD